MMDQLEQLKVFNPAHPLTNFEIQKNYQNEPKSDGDY